MKITEKTPARLVLSSGSWVFVPVVLVFGAAGALFVLFIAHISHDDPAFVAPIVLISAAGFWILANAALV